MAHRRIAYSVTLTDTTVEVLDQWADFFASTRSGVINSILSYYIDNIGFYPPPRSIEELKDYVEQHNLIIDTSGDVATGKDRI